MSPKVVLFVVIGCFCTAAVLRSEKQQVVFEGFTSAPTSLMGDFDAPGVTIKEGLLTIDTRSGRGGVIYRGDFDLGNYAAWTPRLTLKVGEGNQSPRLRMFLQDESGTRRSFTFDLRRVSRGERVELFAQDFPSMAPDDPDDPFAHDAVVMWQLQGSWTNQAHDVVVDEVALVAPTPDMEKRRQAAAERRRAEALTAQEAEQARQARIAQMLQHGVPVSPEGARVRDVGPVSPTVLALTLRDREVVSVPRSPYVAEEGDEIRGGRNLTPAWTPEGIQIVPKENRLRVRRNGRMLDHGFIYQVRGEGPLMLWREETRGDALTLETVDEPEAYRISSVQDERYWDGLSPLAVHRKAKPHNGNDINGDKVIDHRLYLELPYELQDGLTYTVSFPGLNARVDSVSYVHSPRKTVSEAVHVNHIGYRPEDPFKRAFLSLWMGTGGGLEYEVDRFEILDAETGETVYEGPITESFPASRPEGFRTRRNFVGADVHYLDFHDFDQPGTYRIHVPGVGVSQSFALSDEDSWASAFRTSMHGFLSHRSGLELGSPFTRYERPRNMHPDDGFLVYTIPYTMLEGEADIVKVAIREKMDSGVPPESWETHQGAWGGYMDAGDWDRRSQHLSASRHLAELFSINPGYFETFSLMLPPEEAEDGIPDILNEVIWNVSFYRRLQEPDGGVRGGVESAEHPRPGEASWEESLVIAVFAPDPYTSYSYAAAAALLARLLQPYDPEDAQAYGESARLAWDWAEANAYKVLDEAEARLARMQDGTSRSFRRQQAENRIREMRFVAAGELYALTGEESYHKVFQNMFQGIQSEPDELGALMRYARLPEEQVDPGLRDAAIRRIVDRADTAIVFGRENAFGLHTQAPNVPMMGYVGFYSVPEMVTGPALPRAYVLTGDERYLQAALKAAHYSAGANPLNMTMTTGVGHHYPQNPLHIDSRVTGQPAPVGITIYGPMDASADFGFNNWVHTWHLQDMVPGSRTWPAAEWHVDLFRWPAMSEYTIHQMFRPTAYYWGFLAARD